TSSINPAALPGFAFNNTGPLGNNPIFGPGIVGFQGLGNLGVGRATSGGTIGGFVFSAGSDAFTLLIRALKTQGRIDVLSRPQVQALDNQQARILVGQSFPYITGITQALGGVAGTTAVVSNTVNYRDIGVQLQVTPRISPEGSVLMRVIPEVSSPAPTNVLISSTGGTNVFATAFNVQTVETTVAARDGETVAIGGLIQKKDEKHENKIPWFGDLPGVGALFRFRTQTKSKTELLVIMTPHIVRSAAERERILIEEAHRMDWCLGDVVKMHGPAGLGPLLAPPPDAVGPHLMPGAPPSSLDHMLPEGMMPPAQNSSKAAPSREETPTAQITSMNAVPASGSANAPATPAVQWVPPAELKGASTPAATAPAATPEPAKEKRGWNLFRRK
ncbi:MAG TPA: hypothetical protein VKI65_00850, partial [Gemmataceae bacterium]|nr:hypothetical protein [Gemmataceae bacterium]